MPHYLANVLLHLLFGGAEAGSQLDVKLAVLWTSGDSGPRLFIAILASGCLQRGRGSVRTSDGMQFRQEHGDRDQRLLVQPPVDQGSMAVSLGLWTSSARKAANVSSSAMDRLMRAADLHADDVQSLMRSLRPWSRTTSRHPIATSRRRHASAGMYPRLHQRKSVERLTPTTRTTSVVDIRVSIPANRSVSDDRFGVSGAAA